MVTRIGDIVPPVPGAAGADTAATPTGKDFASFVREAADASIDTLHKGEEVSMAGITGQADLTGLDRSPTLYFW